MDQLLESAPVPLVKMVHARTGVLVDIVFNNEVKPVSKSCQATVLTFLVRLAIYLSNQPSVNDHTAKKKEWTTIGRIRAK